jgi:hypothetical protein
MLGELTDRAASILERRFLKNAFLPVLLFFPALSAPLLLQGGRLEELAADWDKLTGTLKFFIVAGYFSLVWFLAAVVASQWRNIIRLFEGYPLARLVPTLAERGRTWHQRTIAELENSDAAWRLYYDYPRNPADVLPTRLGNIMRAAERYPHVRYGADTIIVWSRLYHVMPQEFRDDVQEARADLEFLLVIGLWSISFGLLSLLLLALVGSPPVVTASCFALGIGLGYACYRSALNAAREYGEHLKSGFELYRLDLLERLRYPPPGSVEEEQAAWEAVSGFVIYLSDADAWPYAPPPPSDLSLTIPATPPGGS